MIFSQILPRLRQWIWRLPLRRKLLLKSYLIAVVAALVVSSVFAVHRLLALRTGHLADALAITRMAAENSAGPVAFRDSTAATAVLTSLRAKESIVGAVIDLPRQHNFAVFGVAPAVENRLTGETTYRFDGWILQTAAPITDEESHGAVLQVVSDLHPDLWATLRAFFFALATALTLALTLSHFASNRLRSYILSPIETLHAATQRVGQDADYGHRAPVVSPDELGELTVAFNRMLDRLQTADSQLRTTNETLTGEIAERRRLEKALVDTSRHAGMAEVATGILHNVGNVLNSVNISTQLMREKLDRSRLVNLGRVADLIREHGDHFARYVAEDPKGRLLPGFIVNLSTALADEHLALGHEVNQLSKNIEHIKEIVSAQQGFAKKVGVLEQLAPTELFSEAERIAQASILRHGIEIVYDYADAPQINVDRHRALQILVNFVTNAIHAIKANAPGARRITLRVTTGGGRVAFSVVDNGVGIAAENLNRIFTHGFTTREDGHGFGLHSGAIAARLLGGEVKVTSDGPGLGASFTLDLPQGAGVPLVEPALA